MLVFAVGFGLVACGDDDDAVTPSTGGKGGAGGNSSAGKNNGGAAGTKVTPTAGSSEGGDATGGHAGDGSGAESPGGMGAVGGDGGAGGMAPIDNCGNGVVDSDEWCDGSADCSAKCTLKTCDACTAEKFPATDPITPVQCSTLGATEAALCQAVVDCVTTKGCASADKAVYPYRASLPCYCGDLDFETCRATASSADLDGACKKELNAAYASAPTPEKVLGSWAAGNTALGTATSQVDDPGPLPQGCARLATAAERAACNDILVCLHRTSCANDTNDGSECYCGTSPGDECWLSNDPADTKLNGACKAVIQSAAGGAQVAPITIGQMFFKINYPVGAAMNFATVHLLAECQDECFSGAGGAGN